VLVDVETHELARLGYAERSRGLDRAHKNHRGYEHRAANWGGADELGDQLVGAAAVCA
jgi:hypothetical protein